ncbi:hypothetical protein TRVA0_042S00870 [Trichomonascus vanleenenianus]|uniref:uncharacterized protein n=1 Tax=Trichomonascus vanleenenianus TaxID=2268995 RepID=UPI003ECABDFA
MKLATILATAACFGSSALAHILGPITVGQYNDTKGNPVQIHSGGIFTGKDGKFYAYGNDFSGDTGGDPFKAVALYTTKDLKNFEYVSDILTPDSKGWNDTSTNCTNFAVLERPKIIYNKKTHKYVLYSHVTDASYSVTMVGVATANDITGPWEFVTCYKPGGSYSWDQTVYEDDDGSAYLIYSSNADGTGTNGALRISKLSEDYLSVDVADVATGRGQLESPTVFKNKGLYTLVVSHTSGWSSNPNVYNQARSVADLLSGGFSTEIAPDSSNTYNSQIYSVLPIHTRFGTSYIYLGDRNNYPLLSTSEYVWLPMNVTSEGVNLVYYDSWCMDTNSGRYFEC